MTDAPILIDEKQAADRLGLSADYLYRLRINGPRRRSSKDTPLPPGPAFLRIGRRVVYRPADLEKWLDDMAAASGCARASCRRGRPTKAEQAARLRAAA
ncbi:AlpA family transcriptional regulator [Gluconobacter sp. P1C6_b]|uniref:helix-turn-helix transcriptional regulator n=1 Tax=Gluconobacter sp. P1C6_b TaxID=2762619 RepID=UPI00211286E3|nr:helix-turn-helix domain-containing protein [Gluconobacter sp. P1C6_b]